MTISYEKRTKNITIIMTHSVCTNEVEFRGEKVPEYFFETEGNQGMPFLAAFLYSTDNNATP